MTSHFIDLFSNAIQPLLTTYTPDIADGLYIFEISTNLQLIEFIKEAILQIYRGTYYLPYEDYISKFNKPGNLLIAYFEDGKPVIASCMLWHNSDHGILEIGQGYALPDRKTKKAFLDLAKAFMDIGEKIQDLSLLMISTCRKSATDSLSESFGMKMTGMVVAPALRVDAERILKIFNENPANFGGVYYNILYQLLNYHFVLFNARLRRSMKFPEFIKQNSIISPYLRYFDYDMFPIEYKEIEIDPIVIDFSFDESNSHVINEIWPITHPKLKEKIQFLSELPPDVKTEVILGTVGPYFYYESEDLYIPGIVFARGTIYPYEFSVEYELKQSFQSAWEKLPMSIQVSLKEAFFGFNVTKEVRKFYIDHPEIFDYFLLNPNKFRGLTFKEKKKIGKIISAYPDKNSEAKVIESIQKIINKK
jgi:hypothetical protein